MFVLLKVELCFSCFTCDLAPMLHIGVHAAPGYPFMASNEHASVAIG
jgi:hypothetical protein